MAKNRVDTNEELPVEAVLQNTVRYVCHGCTKNAGEFSKPVLNAVVICPWCGMEQLTKLENFIAL